MDEINILEKLVSLKTITPNEDGGYTYIKSLFPDFQTIEQEIEGVKNLFLYKKNGGGKHLCFAGHIDVVPPGSGWSSDPFIPEYKDGYMYGRGTQDMKSGLSSFMAAIRGIPYSGTISMLFTSDEEGDGIYGTLEMLKHLKEIDMLPDMAIIAEPTSEKAGCDTIKVGRRGSINGVLKIFGKQGHAAYPEKSKNPVDIIAPLLEKIAGYHLDNGDEYFTPSRITITDIRAGMEASNVTPGELKMMFNVRNSNKTTVEDIKNYLEELLKGVEYSLELKQGSKPFITDRDSNLIKIAKEAIKKVCGIEPNLSTTGGTSDARYFAGEFGIETIELGVINDRIHAVDERVSLLEIKQLKEVFAEIIKRI